MLFSPVYIESHLRPFTLSLEGLFSFLVSPVVSFLQPSNLQTFQRSTCLGRRLPQHSNLQPANISTPLNPKSLPLNPFADPHPLNLYATIFYKNMAGEGDAPAPVGVTAQSCFKSFSCNTYGPLRKCGKQKTYGSS